MMKISLLFVLLMFGVSFSALAISSWTLSSESYRPGGSGVLTLEVSNPLVSGGNTKTINGIAMDVYSSPELTVSNQKFIGDIEPGGSTKISLPFKVLPTTKSDIYSIEIKLTGVSDRTEGGFDSFLRRITVPITVVNEPILSISSDKQLIGGIDKLALKIKNDGGAINNLKIRLPSDSKIALYGATQIFVPRVSNEENVSLTLDSREVADGPNEILFLLEYEDEIGIKHTENTSLRLIVRNEQLDVKFNQESDVLTKKESELILKIKNSGTETLKDVRLVFNSQQLRFKDVNEIKFGDLAPGEESTSKTTVFTDISPGINQIKSEISWIEKDIQKREDRNVPITVSSDTDVGVFLEAKPSPLVLNGQHTISVLVSNLGSYKIDNVDVSISSSALKSLDISNSQFIGGLQSNDFSSVQFQMAVNSTSIGTYPIEITVNYRDLSGTWKKRTIERLISIQEPIANNNNQTLPCIGLVILVLLGIGVWYFKFRKGANS